MARLKYYNTITKSWENISVDGKNGYTPLKGVDYFDGKDGKSAYQYAQEAGYIGTEEEFAQKLTEKSPKALHVTILDNGDGTGTSDKTYEEILAAYENGSAILGRIDTEETSCVILNLMSKEDEFAFGVTGVDANGLYWAAMVTKDEGTLVGNLPLVHSPVIGTTAEITPSQVAEAIEAGRDVSITHSDATFSSFTKVDGFNGVFSPAIFAHYDDTDDDSYSLIELYGDTESNRWTPLFTQLVQKSDIPTIPESLKNPHALTINGISYDGSKAVTIEDVKDTPDWNASEDQPGHVLNRTHWVGSESLEIVNGNYTTKYFDMYSAFCIDRAFDKSFDKLPDKVTILYDGTEYSNLTYVYIDGMGYMCGNLYYANSILGTSFENTGEPFIFGFSEHGFTMLTLDIESTEHSVVVNFINGEKIHKLDNKFIDAEWMATDIKVKCDPYFDGDITKHIFIPITDEIGAVKISNYTPSEDECIGASVIVNMFDITEATQVITKTLDYTEQFGVPCFALSSDTDTSDNTEYVFVVKESGMVEGIEITTGTYYLYVNTSGMDGGKMHAKYCSVLENATESIPNKLPMKYLPDDIGFITDSEKEAWNAKADIEDIPNVLPNPNALTFTGAVTKTYDGSNEQTINIVGKAGTGIKAEIFNSASEASGNYSHAEGVLTTASGDSSHAEGVSTIASGYASHAEGQDTTASGNSSHAEGSSTEASGYNSHAEGYGTIASGNRSHAEGIYTKAFANCSHAEGIGSNYAIIITGNANATTYTLINNSSAQQIIAGDILNYNDIYATITKVNGSNITVNKTLSSTALSEQEILLVKGIAFGSYSHVEGQDSVASGTASHAEGVLTTASGNRSHAEGTGTIAASDSQHVQGKYNIKDTNNKYAHIVGNGKNAETRSNAHTLDWEGNAWYAGEIECTSIILKSSTEGSTKKFRLTIDDSGTITAIEIT